MRLPPTVEPLEERMVLGDVNAPIPAVALPAPASGEVAHLLATLKVDGLHSLDLAAQDLAAPAIQYQFASVAKGASLPDNDDDSPLDDALDAYRQSAREVLSSLVSSLTSDSDDANTALDIRSVPSRDMTGASFPDRSPVIAETSGSALPPWASASAENTSALDLIAGNDDTVDWTSASPFADMVILDAWREGLPAPQPELTPTVDKNLTLIATYLVDAPAFKQTPEITPGSGTEPGPTDFIVGFQERQSAALPPTTAANRPEAPAAQAQEEPSSSAGPLVPLSPGPAKAPAPSSPDTCALPPPEDQDNSPDRQPDAGGNNEPEETGDGEEAS